MNILKLGVFFSVLFVSTIVNAQKRSYVIKNIASNSKNSDYGVSFLNDSSVVFSSSRSSGLVRKRVWKGNNQPYLDIYKGTVDSDGEIRNVKVFSKRLNTKFHESDLIFTKDRKTVYFSRNNYLNHRYRKSSTGWNNIKMYKASVLANGNWGEVLELPFSNDEYSVGHPALNADETQLYFTSDMPGSLGGTDIWVVTVLEGNEYGTPKNVGNIINTDRKEMFPYVIDDKLYFSSEGHASIGNLDIFQSTIGTNNFSKPVNLGGQINSLADDFAFVIRNQGKEFSGYFSSNREGGKGDDDIYYFVREKCVRYIEGLVKETESKELLTGSTVTLYTAHGVSQETQLVGQDASFKFEVECDMKYKIVGLKAGYDNDEKWIVALKPISDNNILFLKKERIKTLEGVVNRQERVIVNINPIYFDFNKASIRPDAAVELDKVVAVMQRYPHLIVSSGSHTDARGNDAYNIKLATRRANATVRYIVQKGISSERISGQGYGENRLRNHCSNGVRCSKDQHQLNRRTEFVVINPESIQ
ncbi:MAG: flagellar motor protein MotB [Flavobacteriaceae bacterium]|nr:MAG: flagellar motor protein MotB [Flavobacteriaceae bacterium]